jgi:hypothetical protein
MPDDVKLAELKLACMDPDVLCAAAVAGIQIPEMEDSEATFVSRKDIWDKFRAWCDSKPQPSFLEPSNSSRPRRYTNNEERDPSAAPLDSKSKRELLKEGGEAKTQEKKKKEPPKIAEPRQVFGRNEAAAAAKDEAIKAEYKQDPGAPSIEFRNWYNASATATARRNPFLLRLAKRMEDMRRTTVVLREYVVPTPPLFQVVTTPIREGPPPMERRVRLFGSRYPETFTWDEVDQWYEEGTDG